MPETEEATTAVDPTIDTFAMAVDFKNGLKVDIEVKFPKGNGIAAIHAFQRLGSQEGLIGLLEALSYDQSVQERLDSLGLAIEQDEEEDDPDDGFEDEGNDEDE